jgi:hypothetical protein
MSINELPPAPTTTITVVDITQTTSESGGEDSDAEAAKYFDDYAPVTGPRIKRKATLLPPWRIQTSPPAME